MARKKGDPFRFESTDEQRKLVMVLAGTLVPHRIIARNVGDGIDEKTLRKHFAEELATGKEQLVASLKAGIVRAAQGGNVRAMCWLLDRLDPSFSARAWEAKARAAGGLEIPVQGMVITIKGGLPQEEPQSPPSPNGQDRDPDPAP
jgi:hypothetical protein